MKMTQNRINIANALRKGTIRAICGYPGIGKTFLATFNPQFEDGFLSEHLYLDKMKGVRNPRFPSNYTAVVRDIIQRGKTVLTAMSDEARQVFENEEINFLVLYPSAEEKERYFNIYDTRPDVREWISYNKEIWDAKILKMENLEVPLNSYKDQIPKGMTLSQYLDEIETFCSINTLAEESE